MYIITPNTTFPEMVRLTTNVQKMRLDKDDRLHLPLPDWERGMCPLSYTYKINDDQWMYFASFNQKIEDRYNVQLPSMLPGRLVLATQFFINSVLLGESLVNGQAHTHIQEFRHTLFGRLAMGMRAALDGTSLPPESIN